MEESSLMRLIETQTIRHSRMMNGFELDEAHLLRHTIMHSTIMKGPRLPILMVHRSSHTMGCTSDMTDGVVRLDLIRTIVHVILDLETVFHV